MRPSRKSQPQRSGIGQLTLVEHALCPLDSRPGVVDNLVHLASFRFSDAKGKRQIAKAKVFCPLGLSPNDELYLWGLLALTMTHCAGDSELRATPHWCLRQLNLIDPRTRRGGRQYQQFADSLRRLSVVKYVSDNFYDPIRSEHRQVSFGFLSYSLPRDLNSNRCWRIAWDPVFFEQVSAAAGHFRFDLECYRNLDAATRRLFLFVSKVFARRPRLPTMDLAELAVNLLGFSKTLAARDMKVKVTRCIERLQELEVVGDVSFERIRTGEYRVTLARGAHFSKRRRSLPAAKLSDDPLWDALVGIGFDQHAASRLLRRYPRQLLAEWADITQARKERFGSSAFHKSPMAYLVDSVSKAARGMRTPPDWWQALSRAESRPAESEDQGETVFDHIRDELFDPSPIAESSDDGVNTDFAAIGEVFRKPTRF